MEERASVYRFYDGDGQLLYVGRTQQIASRRIAQHRSTKDWFEQVARIEVTAFDSWSAACIEEDAAIATERPIHNQTDTSARIASAPVAAWVAVSAQTMPISEAKAKLTELVRDSDSNDVVLLRHGRPSAVLMSVRRHAALMERLDDLEDRLAVYERDGVTMDFDKLTAELGIEV
jgi:antitoxin StbD